MSAIEPGSGDGGDKELTSVRVLSGVRHRQPTGSVMLQSEVLILELVAVNRTTCEQKHSKSTGKILCFKRENYKKNCIARASTKTWTKLSCLPPVPSPRVKSPPWIMKSLITRWNLLPLYPPFCKTIRYMQRKCKPNGKCCQPHGQLQVVWNFQ